MTPVLLSDRPTSLVALPPEDATRRKFITSVGAAALAAAFLAACGDDEAAGETPESAPSTREVSHEFGTTAIPVDPQRIAVVDVRSIENLVALGIIPQAVFTKPVAHVADQLDGVTVLETAEGEVDLELLAQIEPDLILAWGNFIEETRDQIAQIAPLVGVRHEQFNDWKGSLRDLARIMDREEQAEAAIAAFEARAADIAGRIEAAGLDQLTVSVIRGITDGFRLAAANESFPAPILDEAGLTRTDVQRNTPTDFGEISLSLEQTAQAEADIIIVVHRAPGENPAQAEALEEMMTSPLWQTLTAAKEGRVYDVSIDHWLQGGPIAANLILDDIERHLLG
ncbi:MAG: ABC transporter substrate-binding protein [Dehalococcoidia bacterium]|nr:ABC transporter substrate-binding protein [Dehalococcoidia bacterium]